jgi:type I restriction enzyme S subunit
VSDKKKLKSGWRWVKFGEVVRLSKARSQDPIADGFERYVGLEHLEPGDLRVSSWGNVADGVTFTNIFQPGQVLFGKRRAYQRKVAVADFAGICSGDIYVLESKDPNALLPALLPFLCQTDAFFDYAIATSAGSLSPRTNWSSLAEFEFALPPIEEQQKITGVLHALEEFTTGSETLATALRRLRRALMIEHFEGLYSEYRKVSEIGTWHSGGTPSRGNPAYWGGSIPWISPKDMKHSELGSSEELLTPQGVEAGSKLMPTDTIMIVVRGMILAHTFPVVRTTSPAAFNQDVKALVVGPEFRPKYIQYWFEYASSHYLQLVSESSHGTKRLESDKLFSLKVPRVTFSEQDAFIEQVGEIRAAIGRAEIRRTDGLSMKRLFMSECVAPLESSHEL